MKDNLLTIREAAKYLKVHWQTVRNYIQKNQLPAVKIGRTIRVSLHDLQNFNKSNVVVREVELRYAVKDRDSIEEKVRKLGAKLTNHSHIIDTYYCDNSIKNLAEKNKQYNSAQGYGIRVRQIDNDYTGRIVATLEVKKLAGPDYNDHSNCLESEIDINNVADTEKLLVMMNQKKFATVDKERFVYRLGDIKLCFDNIKGYITGLEIEKMTSGSLLKTKQEIEKIARSLGLKEKDRLEYSLTNDYMNKFSQF